jgi:pantoate--beta-alanine ligase
MELPDLIATSEELRSRAAEWRRAGEDVALVPTMGALHAGHLSLVSEAENRADRVIVSVFVNPRQFAPLEDFARYPRDIETDCAKLAAHGLTDIVWAPAVDAFYPEDFATRIEMAGPAAGLESDFRPHFFSGVATVVAKLFIAAAPDFAMFGEKDYQQLLVVRRLTVDLGLPMEIVGCPIVREPDGLALSSRNAYLGASERAIAGQLNRTLRHVGELVRDDCPITEAEAAGRTVLLESGFGSVDYVAVRDAETLTPLKARTKNMRVLAAATIGGVRLIDNIAV